MVKAENFKLEKKTAHELVCKFSTSQENKNSILEQTEQIEKNEQTSPDEDSVSTLLKVKFLKMTLKKCLNDIFGIYFNKFVLYT